MGNVGSRLCGAEGGIFRRFQIEEDAKLGSGGFGTTLRALDRQNKTYVAAKCVSLRKMSLERIEREVQITRKVAHEHVITVYGAARRRDEYVIFLELCTEELFALVERRHVLTEKECKRFMGELLSAVEHIHRCGVLHRDLKLENLMLTADASLRVIDFGLAHQYATREDGTHKVEALYHCCGSRSYCAPEVLNQAGYAFGADVWSCGVALFAMLLGFFPLEEASPADWRYDKLKRAQDEGKCTVGTVLQWYGKSHKLSDEALSLLDGMLAIDQTRRLSPSAILKHAWFTAGPPAVRTQRSPAAYRTRGRAAEEEAPAATTSRPDKQASWAAYLVGSSARLLTSLTGVDFKAGATITEPDGKRRPVYRAAEVDAMLADVLQELDGEGIAPPSLRRNAQFGEPGYIAYLPDSAPQALTI